MGACIEAWGWVSVLDLRGRRGGIRLSIDKTANEILLLAHL